MAYGYKTCKTGDQIQAHNRDNSHQDVIDYQHIFIADIEKQRPGEQGGNKNSHCGPVQTGEKNPLLFPVGGEIIACGQPSIRCHSYTRSIS